MSGTDFSKQVEVIVGHMKERINLAIGIAADEKHTFGEGEKIFREVLAALEQYQCCDIAADQLVNFSKVACFRGEWSKALVLAEEAVEKAVSGKAKADANANLHGMACLLLENVLSLPVDAPEAALLAEIEQILTPDEYTGALRKTAAAVRNADSEKRKRMVDFAHRLSMEVLRQGIRQEKMGNKNAAEELFRGALPFLNSKRAAVVQKELEKLEAAENG